MKRAAQSCHSWRQTSTAALQLCRSGSCSALGSLANILRCAQQMQGAAMHGCVGVHPRATERAMSRSSCDVCRASTSVEQIALSEVLGTFVLGPVLSGQGPRVCLQLCGAIVAGCAGGVIGKDCSLLHHMWCIFTCERSSGDACAAVRRALLTANTLPELQYGSHG